MNLYIYSDESGVFDAKHNDIFVFAGVLFSSKETRILAGRKYIHAEETIRRSREFSPSMELKAATISNKEKGKLYRSLNQIQKFGAVIHQKDILPQIFHSKKSKQRFLDYVYKIAVKRKFEALIKQDLIHPNTIENLFFYVDEHTTATNGKYELRESLEQEFRYGTYNANYSMFFPPIFPNLQSVELKFCNSQSVSLVRAADIIANKLYFMSCNENVKPSEPSNFHVTLFPSNQEFDI